MDIGDTSQHSGEGRNSLNRMLNGTGNSLRISRGDYIEIQALGTAKETCSKAHKQPTEWEEICTSYTSDKGLIQRIAEIKY